jgi:hypothetical protein
MGVKAIADIVIKPSQLILKSRVLQRMDWPDLWTRHNHLPNVLGEHNVAESVSVDRLSFTMKCGQKNAHTNDSEQLQDGRQLGVQ